MKTIFVCEVCDSPFNTLEQAEACEALHARQAAAIRPTLSDEERNQFALYLERAARALRLDPNATFTMTITGKSDRPPGRFPLKFDLNVGEKTWRDA